MVEQLWIFAKAAVPVFTESDFYQIGIGFGQCPKQPRISKDAAYLAMTREAAMRSLQRKIMAPTTKRMGSTLFSCTPLLDAETAEKKRWACRLQAIVTWILRFSTHPWLTAGIASFRNLSPGIKIPMGISGLPALSLKVVSGRNHWNMHVRCSGRTTCSMRRVRTPRSSSRILTMGRSSHDPQRVSRSWTWYKVAIDGAGNHGQVDCQ